MAQGDGARPHRTASQRRRRTWLDSVGLDRRVRLCRLAAAAAVVEIVVDAARGRVPVVAGVAATTIAACCFPGARNAGDRLRRHPRDSGSLLPGRGRRRLCARGRRRGARCPKPAWRPLAPERFGSFAVGVAAASAKILERIVTEAEQLPALL